MTVLVVVSSSQGQPALHCLSAPHLRGRRVGGGARPPQTLTHRRARRLVESGSSLARHSFFRAL